MKWLLFNKKKQNSFLSNFQVYEPVPWFKVPIDRLHKISLEQMIKLLQQNTSDLIEKNLFDFLMDWYEHHFISNNQPNETLLYELLNYIRFPTMTLKELEQVEQHANLNLENMIHLLIEAYRYIAIGHSVEEQTDNITAQRFQKRKLSLPWKLFVLNGDYHSATNTIIPNSYFQTIIVLEASFVNRFNYEWEIRRMDVQNKTPLLRVGVCKKKYMSSQKNIKYLIGVDEYGKLVGGMKQVSQPILLSQQLEQSSEPIKCVWDGKRKEFTIFMGTVCATKRFKNNNYVPIIWLQPMSNDLSKQGVTLKIIKKLNS